MKVRFVTVTESSHQQRIDNFLFKHLKGVPKSRVYRALRNGEVRVNKKRVKAHTRLRINDEVRIPPMAVAERVDLKPPSSELSQYLLDAVVFEDENCLVLDKPAGMAVHAGTSENAGIIELLRMTMCDLAPYLELVHRLDKPTSGCLLVAKSRQFLTLCQDLLVNRQVNKTYHALVKGRWSGGERTVDAALLRYQRQDGESAVKVDSSGKSAVTRFRPLERFSNATLVEAMPITGRTHQIRVHAAHIGHPIAMDEKYGCWQFNRQINQLGLKRLFLHAASLVFEDTIRERMFGVCIPLSKSLRILLQQLN